MTKPSKTHKAVKANPRQGRQGFLSAQAFNQKYSTPTFVDKKPEPVTISKLTAHPNVGNPVTHVVVYNPITKSQWFRYRIPCHGSYFTLTQVPGKNAVFNCSYSESDSKAYIKELLGTKKYVPSLRLV